MQQFSHTDNEGRARMVDVGNKPDQKRIAVAEGFIELQAPTLKLIRENQIKKGDVITVSRIAGIQAAKRTAGLIPLCHPLSLTHIAIEEEFQQKGLRIKGTVETTGKTGVEMEALTAVSVSLLTIYDMCKAVDNKMRIERVRLIEKTKE